MRRIKRQPNKKPAVILDTGEAIEVSLKKYPVSAPKQESPFLSHNVTAEIDTVHRHATNTTSSTSYLTKSLQTSSSDDEIYSNSSTNYTYSTPSGTMFMPQVDLAVAWTNLREYFLLQDLEKIQVPNCTHIPGNCTHIPGNCTHIPGNCTHIPRTLQFPNCTNVCDFDDDDPSIDIVNDKPSLMENDSKAHRTLQLQNSIAEEKPLKTNLRAHSHMIIQTQSSLSEIVPHSYHPCTLKEERQRITLQTKPMHEIVMHQKSTSYSSSSPLKQNSKFDRNAAGKTLEYFPEKGSSMSITKNTKPINQQDILSRNHHLDSRTCLINHSFQARDDVSRSSLFTHSKNRYSYPYLEEDDTLYGKSARE